MELVNVELSVSAHAFVKLTTSTLYHTLSNPIKTIKRTVSCNTKTTITITINITLHSQHFDPYRSLKPRVMTWLKTIGADDAARERGAKKAKKHRVSIAL
jgi:hypothetical protein